MPDLHPQEWVDSVLARVPALETALRDGIAVLGWGTECAGPLAEIAGRFGRSRCTAVVPTAADRRARSKRAPGKRQANVEFVLESCAVRRTIDRVFDWIVLAVPPTRGLIERLGALVSPGGILICPGSAPVDPREFMNLAGWRALDRESPGFVVQRTTRRPTRPPSSATG